MAFLFLLPEQSEITVVICLMKGDQSQNTFLGHKQYEERKNRRQPPPLASQGFLVHPALDPGLLATAGGCKVSSASPPSRPLPGSGELQPPAWGSPAKAGPASK